MTFLHPVQTNLNLMDAEFFGSFFSNQRAIRKQDRAIVIIPQDVIDFPEVGMELGFSAGEEKP
jgi:hypothetical protein